MNAKTIGILSGVGLLIVLLLIGWGLYVLGDADQSALERLRDIAVIFVVLLFLLVVLLLGAITGALVFLTMQVKDRVIPLLEEATGTARRVRGTTNFITEEAVRPLINVAAGYSRMRRMRNVVTGKTTKPPKVGKI
ncbi:MAG: hypothetical protein M3121_01380 [Chloroflexota bacterium]|nr:hypothetical protein [Chloroflexota bacterium]